MKDNKEETIKKLSNFEKQFLKLVEEKPLLVLEALCKNDIIKPLIWNDSIRNGGKLGYRPIALKYGISDNKARWILKKIEERNNG